MKRSLTTVIAATALVSAIMSPAWSDDAGSVPTAGDVQPSAAAATQKKSLPHFVEWPKIALGVVVGTFAGMPIAAVRKARDEERDGIKFMAGDTNQKVVLVPIGLFWAPLAIVTGILEAPIYGPMDAFKNYDKPFSKEQFSLGDLP